MSKKPTSETYFHLITDLSALIERGRKAAAQYVNTALVITYWLIGRRVVEYEQQGEKRAGYGEAILKKLSADLAPRFGKSFTERNLGYMRQFYLAYQEISNTVRSELSAKSLSKKSFNVVSDTLSQAFPLAWSHYRLLMRLDNKLKRDFYEIECRKGNWSTRQLDRQIQSMLFERTALSKRKAAVIAKAHEKPIPIRPEDEIKEPYVLEFLNLKDEYSELELEEALIRHLEDFLLEMGIGFTFVARQRRITIEGTHFRLDLLLYHRVLRCLVVIDLKIGEFTHSDAGQMNLYLNYLKAKETFPGENDPVGMVLCSDKKKTIVEYALGGMSNKIFASKYKVQLPDPEELRATIEYERHRLESTKRLTPQDADSSIE